VLLAGGLGDQEASVAGGAKKKAPNVLIVRVVLCTDGVVRAELAAVEGGVEVLRDSTSGLHEATQGAFGV
jgi:hypothetical protein